MQPLLLPTLALALLLLRFYGAKRGLLFVKFGWNKLMYELERIINFLH
jgi:hypothetical protein